MDREFQVGEDQPADVGLLDPRPGDGGHRAGGDDAVVGGVFGESVGSVGGHQGGPVAERGEPIASGIDEVALDVHGEHMPPRRAGG